MAARSDSTSRGKSNKSVIPASISKRKKAVKVVKVTLSQGSRKPAKSSGKKQKESLEEVKRLSKKAKAKGVAAAAGKKSSKTAKTQASEKELKKSKGKPLAEVGKKKLQLVEASSPRGKAPANDKPSVSVVGAKQVKRKPASSAAKPEALPLVPEKVLTPAEFATPPAELLRPFRAAAKENQKRLREKVKAKRRSTTFLAKGPKKGKKYVADLRVHSPGTIGYFAPGGVDPAQALVRLAKVKGLHMIGLTDYYNAEYVDCVKGFAQGTSVSILPGFDFCCMVGLCAEVHMSALFPEETTSAQIFSVLQELKVPATAQGDSSFVLTTDFEVVLETIEKHGGILIPSRVDKTPYRQLALKTLIEQYGFHAFDLVHPESPDIFREHWPNGEFTFFSFSNANALGQVGNRVSKVKLEAPTFEFLKSRIARRTIH